MSKAGGGWIVRQLADAIPASYPVIMTEQDSMMDQVTQRNEDELNALTPPLRFC